MNLSDEGPTLGAEEDITFQVGPSIIHFFLFVFPFWAYIINSQFRKVLRCWVLHVNILMCFDSHGSTKFYAKNKLCWNRNLTPKEALKHHFCPGWGHVSLCPGGGGSTAESKMVIKECDGVRIAMNFKKLNFLQLSQFLLQEYIYICMYELSSL